MSYSLDACQQHGRVGASAENGAVVGECNPNSVVVIDEAQGLVESKQPEGRGANSPLRETHASGAFGTCVTMVVGHVPVKEIFVVPSNNPGVGPYPCETPMYMLGSDGVKSAANVEESDKAVGL